MAAEVLALLRQLWAISYLPTHSVTYANAAETFVKPRRNGIFGRSRRRAHTQWRSLMDDFGVQSVGGR